MSIKYTIYDDTESGNITKVLCNSCSQSTNHKVIHNHQINGEQELGSPGAVIDWCDNYQVLKCNGCDSISFRQQSWFSEDYDYDDNERLPREIIYPKRNKDTIKLQDYNNLPNHLKRIYRETIDCFNNESYTLAAGGLRSLVEGLCAELKVEDGPVKNGAVEVRKSNLEGKINGLHERNVLTLTSATALHEHRFLGNEALHELSQPSPDELRLAIEIIEHTFKSVFEMPHMHTDLKERRNKRHRQCE